MSKMRSLFLSLFSLALLGNVFANLDLVESGLKEFVNVVSVNDTDSKSSLLNEFDVLLNDVIQELQKEENADIRDEFLKTLNPVSKIKSFKDHHTRELKYSVEKFDKHFDDLSDEVITRGLLEKPELIEKIKKLNLYLYEILLDGKKLNSSNLDKLLDFIYHRPAFYAKNHKKLTITASITVVIVLAIVVYAIYQLRNKSTSIMSNDEEMAEEVASAGDGADPSILEGSGEDKSEITPAGDGVEPSILEGNDEEANADQPKETVEINPVKVDDLVIQQADGGEEKEVRIEEPEITPVDDEKNKEENNFVEEDVDLDGNSDDDDSGDEQGEGKEEITPVDTGETEVNQENESKTAVEEKEEIPVEEVETVIPPVVDGVEPLKEDNKPTNGSDLPESPNEENNQELSINHDGKDEMEENADPVEEATLIETEEPEIEERIINRPENLNTFGRKVEESLLETVEKDEQKPADEEKSEPVNVEKEEEPFGTLSKFPDHIEGFVPEGDEPAGKDESCGFGDELMVEEVDPPVISENEDDKKSNEEQSKVEKDEIEIIPAGDVAEPISLEDSSEEELNEGEMIGESEIVSEEENAEDKPGEQTVKDKKEAPQVIGRRAGKRVAEYLNKNGGSGDGGKVDIGDFKGDGDDEKKPAQSLDDIFQNHQSEEKIDKQEIAIESETEVENKDEDLGLSDFFEKKEEVDSIENAGDVGENKEQIIVETNQEVIQEESKNSNNAQLDELIEELKVDNAEEQKESEKTESKTKDDEEIEAVVTEEINKDTGNKDEEKINNETDLEELEEMLDKSSGNEKKKS